MQVDGRTYIWGGSVVKGSNDVIMNFNRGVNYQENVASRVLKYYINYQNLPYFNAYFNNNKSQGNSFTGVTDGTYIAIGSFFESSAEQLASIDVYAVRIYNRALTDEEIQRNYEIDQYRFGIIE